MTPAVAATKPRRPMRDIDEDRLEQDVPYRVAYLTEFMGMTADDWAAIEQSGEYLAPVAKDLVDAIYEQLFSYNSTQRHFRKPGSGYKGPVKGDIESLDHPYIQFRKEHLLRYLTRLVSGAYDQRFSLYLDWVGKMHTAKEGSAEIAVPLVQMNALMGFVSAAVLGTLWDLVQDGDKLRRYVAAWNKLLWLQNDLISRHYVP